MSAKQNTIALCDYHDQSWQLLVEMESKSTSRRKCADAAEARSRSRGFAATVRVGILHRRQALFAVYCFENDVYLLADGEVQRIEVGVRLFKTSLLFPLISRVAFRLHEEDRRSWTYWHNELLEDGMHTDDFLLYVAERTGSPEKLNDFQQYWKR